MNFASLYPTVSVTTVMWIFAADELSSDYLVPKQHYWLATRTIRTALLSPKTCTLKKKKCLGWSSETVARRGREGMKGDTPAQKQRRRKRLSSLALSQSSFWVEWMDLHPGCFSEFSKEKEPEQAKKDQSTEKNKAVLWKHIKVSLKPVAIVSVVVGEKKWNINTTHQSKRKH